MLFNSYIFIFAFLPIAVSLFYLAERYLPHSYALIWLIVASLFFYGWWNPYYLFLIIGSILFNYASGWLIFSVASQRHKKAILFTAVMCNLLSIGYYKYYNFFIENINYLTSRDELIYEIFLPLAISFFTFQQIAYLADIYNHKVEKFHFTKYFLFVTFFPQLIAGPIVHYQHVINQFSQGIPRDKIFNFLSAGVTIFVIGLFKKIVLADHISIYVSPVFSAAEAQQSITFLEAWIGALAYSFQLYFDFSGYSDMAIGLALMFGISLPLNFNSPYKANSIIAFWRAWHITLSHFLRDYVYIPLGGDRKGPMRRYINIMITMLLGGVWHGAGWTFILWGGLHGGYILINHVWRSIRNTFFQTNLQSSIFETAVGRSLTFFSIVIAWVVFRANTLDGAQYMFAVMFGGNGISLPVNMPLWLQSSSISFLHFDGLLRNDLVGDSARYPLMFIAVSLGIVWFLPNTMQIMAKFNSEIGIVYKSIQTCRNNFMYWRPSWIWGSAIAIMGIVALNQIVQYSEFLYFNF